MQKLGINFFSKIVVSVLKGKPLDHTGLSNIKAFNY